MKQLWKQFWVLLSLASSTDISITESEWLHKAKQMGKLFREVYTAEDVTPYLHVFVYHCGYYLEQFGSLERFGNYAIEGKHKHNKRIIASATSGFARKESDNNVTMQQLKRSVRELKGAAETTVPKKRRKSKQTWAERSIKSLENTVDVFE